MEQQTERYNQLISMMPKNRARTHARAGIAIDQFVPPVTRTPLDNNNPITRVLLDPQDRSRYEFRHRTLINNDKRQNIKNLREDALDLFLLLLFLLAIFYLFIIAPGHTILAQIPWSTILLLTSTAAMSNIVCQRFFTKLIPIYRDFKLPVRGIASFILVGISVGFLIFTPDFVKSPYICGLIVFAGFVALAVRACFIHAKLAAENPSDSSYWQARAPDNDLLRIESPVGQRIVDHAVFLDLLQIPGPPAPPPAPAQPPAPPIPAPVMPAALPIEPAPIIPALPLMTPTASTVTALQLDISPSSNSDSDSFETSNNEENKNNFNSPANSARANKNSASNPSSPLNLAVAGASRYRFFGSSITSDLTTPLLGTQAEHSQSGYASLEPPNQP
jgi:hypothetical protein